MPFYKWIIDTEKSSKLKDLGYYSQDKDSIDRNAIANYQMTQTIRQLSQLAGIAYEIFGAIENDCMVVLHRTSKLKDRLQNFSNVVESLDAKTVPVPVSSLSASREPSEPFRNKNVDAKSPIFSSIPRPSSVDRLRQLANGPSPPAFIPTTLTDVEQQRINSHTQCQILDQSNSKFQPSKVPATIMPVDVSGQPFSRMASFRRSFISVDFFGRRKKKKDKRRNTVTEGNTKEFKDAFYSIIGGKSSYSNEANLESNYNNNCNEHGENHKINAIIKQETNNNSSEQSNISNSKSKNGFLVNTSLEERVPLKTPKTENEKLELKNHYNSDIRRLSSFGKQKTKGRIPISTVSAAMSVAVEMRQQNDSKSEDQSSSGNWSFSSDPNSSDSDNRRNSVQNGIEKMVSETDSSDSSLCRENSPIIRLKEVDTIEGAETSTDNCESQIESSSCASLENNGITDDRTSNATSVDSEVFFMSSDEDVSDLTFESNLIGSSVSITASNGSLNSLLSQTATEMASSTGTLTSIGLERVPTPPPPPPTIITATANRQFITAINEGISIKNLTIQTNDNLHPKHLSKKEKQPSLQKKTKVLKSDKTITLKNSSDNPKNIFNNFVTIKSQKDRNKTKSSEKIKKAISPLPVINMYGSDSPQNIKQPLFINETIESPISKYEPKHCLQSFSTKLSQIKSNSIKENKPTFLKSESSHESKLFTPIHEASRSSFTYHSEGKDIEVPLKYIHRVTVTPIQRQCLNEKNDSIITCRKTLFKENDVMQIPKYNKTNTEKHFEQFKPERPMTLLPDKPKTAARVLLDPNGRIIQCTNSLNRKLHCVTSSEKYNYTKATNDTKRYIESPMIHNKDKSETFFKNQDEAIQLPHQYNNDINRRYSIPYADLQTNFKQDSDLVHRNNFSFQENYNKGYSSQVQNFYPAELNAVTKNNYSTQSLPRQNLTLLMKPSAERSPNPNISGLPSHHNLLTQHNNTVFSNHMGKCNTQVVNRTNDSAKSCIPSFQGLKSPITPENNKSPTTMSTEDLFAVIHNCKKKMNIKTDSDISLASSSRSNSPTHLRPSVKGTLAETGFLSPRNSLSFDSRDRRSWADFRPSRETCAERKSLASDRLGPTKPTSMHDFKMLLLQTRSNSQILGPRKSAVEMLKVPTSCGENIVNNSMMFNLKPQNSLSRSVPNSPSSNYSHYNGHSTVPFKRNNRVRSAISPRYAIYPPIFEDCSEDSESNRDIQKKDRCLQDTAHGLSHWV